MLPSKSILRVYFSATTAWVAKSPFCPIAWSPKAIVLHLLLLFCIALFLTFQTLLLRRTDDGHKKMWLIGAYVLAMIGTATSYCCGFLPAKSQTSMICCLLTAGNWAAYLFVALMTINRMTGEMHTLFLLALDVSAGIICAYNAACELRD